jgi:hypothetical protein
MVDYESAVLNNEIGNTNTQKTGSKKKRK